MAVSTIEKTSIDIETGAATLASSVTGECSYIKMGNVVTITGNLYITGALANGTNLCSGLPISKNENILIVGSNNNSATETVNMFLRNNGELAIKGSYASANRSIRVAGSYISQ